MKTSGKDNGWVPVERLDEWPSKRLFLGPKRGRTSPEQTPVGPMYQDVSEVVLLISTILEEKTQARVFYVRTIESGAFEEYAVVQKEAGGTTLLLRVWPVFFSYHKRLEYKIYDVREEDRDPIVHLLGVCARVNHASLVPKG